MKKIEEIKVETFKGLKYTDVENFEELEVDESDNEEIDDDSEEDLDEILEEEDLEEIKNDSEEVVLSKHKIEGKHSLKYDSIFKGKKEEQIDEDLYEDSTIYYKDVIEVDKSSMYHYESLNNEDYVKNKKVKERVYDVLKHNTNINFMNNRRKPSRSDFNSYYEVLRTKLKSEGFTNIDIFNELAVYFSDNLFNMFKLLDNKWRNLILEELQEHIGKNEQSKEILNRNIYEGTEIEFMWKDEFGDDKLITGVVIETDYENSKYFVDSYENHYIVELSKIKKILNNSKFKYNLNKLNHIDFL